jgi:uncharacterized caspase-like protein
MVYHQKGEHDRAIADFSEAIRLDPKSSATYRARGATFAAMGARDKAAEDYMRAEILQRGPQSAEQIALGKVLGRRVALVLANSNYADVERLSNPTHDGRAVAASLRRLGFAEVIERYDLGLTEMVSALRDFGDQALDSDWALVYFAGHGLEMNGVPYLIPTDAKLLRDSHVADEALPLERVLDKVAPARRLRLVVLDACRNNPFAARMIRSVSGRSIGRGLARIEPDAGTLVAYASKHGTIALDGSGVFSPFAEAFLHHLEEPGLELQYLFRKVRDRVLQKTGRAQEPFLYGSLSSESFYFKPTQQ